MLLSLALLPLLASPAPLLVYERERAKLSDICVVPASGGSERCLAPDAADDGWPRFYPDGRRVLFSSNRSGNWELWEASLDGGAPRRVTETPTREWQSAVSADGRRVALLSDAPGRDSLQILDLATNRLRELLRHGSRTTLGNPDFSPDGRRVVFSSNFQLGHHIYLWTEGRARLKRLSGLLGGGCTPRFTPDGKRVLYVSRRHLKTTSWIVEHDLATGNERTLVDWPALNYDPALSPDGSELAFASTITGEFQIYRLRLSDGRSWRLSYGPGAARMPDYQPR